jgi:hypothetical protein
MISQSKIREWVNLYLRHVNEITPEVHVKDEEGYKFKSVEVFQRNFDIDASDLAAMLGRAIENTNLVAGNMCFPRKMLLIFADAYPDDTRQALRTLFDESAATPERIDAARKAFEELMDRRNKELGKTDHSYVGLRFLSCLLAFRYPNACNAIKPREWKVFCRFVDEDFNIPQHTSDGNQYKMVEPCVEALRSYIRTVPQVRSLHDELTHGLAFHDDEYRWMAQDVIFVTAYVLAKTKSDPETAHEVVREPVAEGEAESEAAVPTPSGNAPGITFPLEEHLETLIVKNWGEIDFCKDMELFVDEDGTVGQQYTTDVGIIDLLARDKKHGDLVVIELKKGNTDYKVIGQILAYIDWVENNLASKGQMVRGIVIVAQGNKALFAALHQVSKKVSVRYYRVNLEIYKPVEAASE